ncbi:MAG: hypothetical protein IJJ82_03120 [Clostridia bacterium]|nr:hypothetical protein [Clostridia bacterium]
MNYLKDLTQEQQNIIAQQNIAIEDREYSAEEINHHISILGNSIMSKSTKNGDANRELSRLTPVINILLKNQK